MLKTLKNLFKQDKEKFVVPKSVQSVIPIKTIWEDGIFLVGKNKYAKTLKFEDINYAVASREDKEAMFQMPNVAPAVSTTMAATAATLRQKLK